MEIIFKNEITEFEPILVSKIKIGEKFRFSEYVGGRVFTRVKYVSGGGRVYYVDDKYKLHECGAGHHVYYVETEQARCESAPITLGELKVGDHFRFTDINIGGVHRVIKNHRKDDLDKVHVSTLNEKTSRTDSWFGSIIVRRVYSVKLIVSGVEKVG